MPNKPSVGLSSLVLQPCPEEVLCLQADLRHLVLIFHCSCLATLLIRIVPYLCLCRARVARICLRGALPMITVTTALFVSARGDPRYCASDYRNSPCLVPCRLRRQVLIQRRRLSMRSTSLG